MVCRVAGLLNQQKTRGNALGTLKVRALRIRSRAQSNIFSTSRTFFSLVLFFSCIIQRNFSRFSTDQLGSVVVTVTVLRIKGSGSIPGINFFFSSQYFKQQLTYLFIKMASISFLVNYLSIFSFCFLFNLHYIAKFFSCWQDQLGGVEVMESVTHVKGSVSILGDFFLVKT